MESGLSELKKSLATYKYQDILDKIHSLKQQGGFFSLSLKKRTSYLYFEVQAQLKLNNFQKSEEILNQFDQELKNLKLDKLEKLILISLQIDQLTMVRSFDEAGKKVSEGKEIEMKLLSHLSSNDKYWLTRFYDSIISLAMKKFDYQIVFQYVKLEIDIYKELNDLQNLYNTQDLLGIYYINLRQYDSAEKTFLKNQSLIENHVEIVGSNRALYGLGVTKMLKGNLDIALEIFQEINALYFIARIHRIRGDLDKALEFLKQEDKSIPSWAVSLENGEIYYLKNDLETAYRYFQQSLERGRKTFERPPVVILFNLVRVCLELNKTDLAKNYHQKIDQIGQYAKEDQFIEKITQLSEAYILKSSNRMYEKGKALQLFKEVSDDEFQGKDIIILALMNQVELLILELKTFEDPTILNELDQVICRITEIANTLKSDSLLIDSLLMRSKVTLIEGDLYKSLSYVDEAQSVIKERKVDYLQEKVNKFRGQIVDEFQSLQHKYKEDSSYYDRIKQLEIEEYIQKAQKMVELSKQDTY